MKTKPKPEVLVADSKRWFQLRKRVGRERERGKGERKAHNVGSWSMGNSARKSEKRERERDRAETGPVYWMEINQLNMLRKVKGEYNQMRCEEK